MIHMLFDLIVLGGTGFGSFKFGKFIQRHDDRVK